MHKHVSGSVIVWPATRASTRAVGRCVRFYHHCTLMSHPTCVCSRRLPPVVRHRLSCHSLQEWRVRSAVRQARVHDTADRQAHVVALQEVQSWLQADSLVSVRVLRHRYATCHPPHIGIVWQHTCIHDPYRAIRAVKPGRATGIAVLWLVHGTRFPPLPCTHASHVDVRFRRVYFPTAFRRRAELPHAQVTAMIAYPYVYLCDRYC